METIFQAESANLVGALVADNHAGFLGEGFVDFINPSNDYIEFEIDVATTGNYDLGFRYALGSAADRPLELSIDGNQINPSLNFETTGDWANWEVSSQLVNLTAGTHTVRLTATGNSGANIDQLIVTPITPTTEVYQAEDATLSGVEIANEHSGFMGSGFADFINPTNDFIEFEIDIATAGSYDLDFRYALGSAADRPLQLSIDGNQINPSLDFETTGNWANWETSSQLVNLSAGTHTVRLTAIGSSGPNIDQLTVTPSTATPPPGGGGTPPTSDDDCAPISILPCTDVRVEGDIVFNFDGTDGGLFDNNGDGIGFTAVDPSSNPSNPNPASGVVGYIPELIDVDPASDTLRLTTTAGLQIRDVNTLDNALGIGLNLPSQAITLETTLVDIPTAAGGYAQAGLWFGQAEGGGLGSAEDNNIKFVLISPTPGDYELQALYEADGQVISSQNIDIPDTLTSLNLQLALNPSTQTVEASYSLPGGTTQSLTTFNSVPSEWFSFDQAGINPTLNTRSFGGVFASHRNSGTSQVFSFDDFSVTENALSGPPDPGSFDFERWSTAVDNPTAMAFGPDGRLYVATLFGTIVAIEFDLDTNTEVSREVITTINDDEGGNRLTLGLTIDPDSTADNVILWVGHSSGSVNNGELNSSKISRLSGDNFQDKEDVVTGLPRAIANHALNSLDFGPDGRLYAWVGGNTGAGAANDGTSEFGDRAEQPLSAALVEIDIPRWKADPSNFDGDVASPPGEFIDEFYDRKAQELGRPYEEVQVFASGLRNAYDGVFHSSGNIFATDNGLGVQGTFPSVGPNSGLQGDPTDRDDITAFGLLPEDNPGRQPDLLLRLERGGYYGHPNPSRLESVFQDGTEQGLSGNNFPAGHPDYIEPFLELGFNRSANGIIEFTSDDFGGALQGDLIIANFSQGDDLTRVDLSDDGLSVLGTSSIASGFSDPLPLALGPNGTIAVGEFGGNEVTFLEPIA